MTNTVDNRVVELGFNNKEFEQGTQQSLKSIESLKKGLNFDESVKSIGNLSSAGKSFSLASMGESVQAVANRFSTFGIIGMTILQNLTNAAINYGKRMIQSFMQPMKMGFQEYETQMNAIQTVLANTEAQGTTLENVTDALDELNTYADKTIYNFTEMTRNIGTFTAAGVTLETSVEAIKGIANLAAISGSNSQQASTAMYQLSQALSSGTVKLMDWNSVVNAGMGGQVFQEALKETARVSGIAIDDLIAKHGSFRETLSTGWLSSQVLLDTLAKFTGDLSAAQLETLGYNEQQIQDILRLGQTAQDAATKVKTFTQLKDTLQEAIQSGWTKSWQIIIGDFEEAKGLFTEISDTLGALIQESADARNSFLESWKGMGGRAALVDTLRNTFQGLLSILAPIKEAFREIFPPATAGDLFRLTLIIRNLSEKLILSSENADRVKRIFAGLFSIFAIVKDVVVELFGAFFDLGTTIPVTGDGILEFLARIGDFLVSMREGIDVTGLFERAVAFIKDTIQNLIGSINLAKNTFIEWKEAIQDTFGSIFENVDTSGIEAFLDRFQVRFTPFQSLLKILGVLLGALLKGAVALIPGLFRVGQVIFEFVKGIGNAITEGLANINFVEVFDVINTGLIGAILLAIRNFITSGSGVLDEVGGVFGGVVEILDGVRGSLEAWQQNLKSKTLLNIAIAVGILAASLIALSLIDSEKLTTSIGVMTAMFVQLIAAQAAYSKLGGAGLGSNAGLILMATSLLILSGAISVLAKLDKQAMNNALGTIYGLLAGMLIFSKFMSTNKASLLSGGIGMIAVAASMLVLATVVRKLGELDPEILKQGLIGVGAMLAEIAIFMNLVDSKGVSKGLGLLAMAGAVVILAQVVKQLGSLDVETLKKGLVSVAAILAAIAIFTKVSGSGAGLIASAVGITILGGALEIFVDVIKKLGALNTTELAKGLGGMAVALLIIAGAMRVMPKNMVLQAVGMLILAGALKVISEAIQNMGSMSWEEIAKGLVTLAGAMLILTIALYAMTGTLAGSAALLVAAGALAVLANVLVTLGSMGLGEIGLALLSLAGVFLVLGAAGILLTPLVPTLLSLGASLFLIGAGTALVGVGLLAFSTGLLALAAGGAAAALGIVAFVTTLLGLIPVIINTLIDTLIVFAKGIQRAAPEVAKAITALMLGFLQVIIDTAPKIMETLDVLLKGLIQLIVDHVPGFIEVVVDLLVTLLETIASRMPDFIQAGFDILISFLEGIRDNIGEVVVVVFEIVTEFLGAVSEKLPDIIQSGVDLIIAFIDGMSTAIERNSDRLIDSVTRLAGSIIQALIDGINAGVQAVINAIIALVRRVIAAAWAAFDSDSPSKEMMDVAETIPDGLVAGIKKYGFRAIRATKKFGGEIVETMGVVKTAMARLIDDEIDISPTIRPVIDTANIKNASSYLDSIFGTRSLNLSPTLVTASSISKGIPSPVYSIKEQPVKDDTKISFTQINNSPKALSRFEIYRLTRLQLLEAKGLVSQ